jgi:hypothetical protein
VIRLRSNDLSYDQTRAALQSAVVALSTRLSQLSGCRVCAFDADRVYAQRENLRALIALLEKDDGSTDVAD